MSWPTNDPRSGYPLGEPSGQPAMTGPSDPPPWASSPSPIPGYVPPPPGPARGPQDHVPTAHEQPTAVVRPAARVWPVARRQVRYADWGERVGATLVDWGILTAGLVVVSTLTGVSEALEPIAGLGWFGLAGYVAWLNGSKGQSPGKAVMGLKVVRDADGSTLGGPVGLVRALMLPLMFFLSAGVLWTLALLWPVWDRRRQALHDKVVSASVLGGYPRAKFGKDIFRP